MLDVVRRLFVAGAVAPLAAQLHPVLLVPLWLLAVQVVVAALPPLNLEHHPQLIARLFTAVALVVLYPLVIGVVQPPLTLKQPEQPFWPSAPHLLGATPVVRLTPMLPLVLPVVGALHRLLKRAPKPAKPNEHKAVITVLPNPLARKPLLRGVVQPVKLPPLFP